MDSTPQRHSMAGETPRRELDLRDIVDIWYRRRSLLLGIVLLTIIGMEFANYVQYPSFESKVKILLEGPVGLEVPFAREKLVFKKSEITQTQIELLVSRPNLEEVVRSLKLDERAKPTGSLRDTIHAIKDRVIELYYDTKEGLKEFVVVSVLGGRYTPPRKPTPFESAVAHLQRSANLSVESLSNTDFIVATVSDRDPEYAAAIANQLARIYSARELQVRLDGAREIRHSIDRRLAVVEPQLRASREAIALFKQEHGIVSLDKQRDADLEQLARLEPMYWELAQKESVRELSTWEALQRESVGTRDRAQRGKIALVEKLSDLAKLETTYQPDHPTLIAARAAVEELQKQLIEDASSNPPSSSKGTPNLDTESLRKALKENIARIREELASLSKLDSRYQALVWEQNHYDEVYKFLTRKREDASIAEDTTQSQTRLVEPAQPQYLPARPRKWLNRALALLTSLAVATGLCALLEYLDRRVRTPEAAQRLTGLRTLGSIPYMSR